MSYILAESKKFQILHSYESVLLKFKRSDKEVLIGDFYGEPEVAFIAEDESYCVIGGCGIIVYFLKEPFIDYQYDFQTDQWFELNRRKDNMLWVKGMKSGSKPSSIIIEVESNNDDELDIYELDIYSKRLERYRN